ncbi:mitochondrial import inner membrane translocase subunit tim17 family [Trichoderma cornu-damae]|uniref:Mitochondrial import inner membrane translocase subunit tim17 family n=1 Tax=Trichoderma cornu-damae TaxID=654480 RepID=A0A9P8TSJ5_9HYPO|nr:mitochondrial import inner membrane translocase subunit tim17 family [Trichoderma cornu-damae]
MAKPYVPHDVIDETAKTSLVGLGSGVFIAAIQNALSKRNVGAMSVFTRGAPLIGICAAGPGAYAFFSRTMMNLREKEDAWAAAFGGFMCGSVLGLPFKRTPVMLALGAFFGTAQGLFHVAGGRLDSFYKEEDEFERKEIIRRTTRLPVEQTVAELGEGRGKSLLPFSYLANDDGFETNTSQCADAGEHTGIRPPGYEERRRERIKEKYGFEVDPVNATIQGSQ